MMKRLFVLLVLCFAALTLSATGVLVNRYNPNFQIATLNECHYEVDVNNQIAQVKVTETFANNSAGLFYPRLYFPMPRGANATRLRWAYGETWNEASIADLPQSTPGGPSNVPDNFIVYMQLMPLVFDAPDSLHAEESIRFEITYVQLLNYNIGSVTINLKNDYTMMQTTPLLLQSMQIDITSNEQILDFSILGVNAVTSHTNNTATGSYTAQNLPANATYRCVWHHPVNNTSSWGLSTMMDETPDDGPPGFFLYTFREQSLPADSVFNLRLNIVIDVSGSMSLENRLVNAKIAAAYIVNNLIAGDMFNIILFDHIVRPLWDSLRPLTIANREAALTYIQNYQMPSLNGTNLYAAMQRAVFQLPAESPGIKNCILLLSDGQPTVGTTDTYQIINSLNTQIAANESNPYIFCFGIGTEVNYQLLNALAQHHLGVSIFLESAEMQTTIPAFYDVMRNPIFTYPVLDISPTAEVFEVFPDPFPSIYGKMQYRIVGRYAMAQQIELELSGLHNGVFYDYLYPYQLTPESIETNAFIPKIWASAKIDKLLIEYYNYPPDSPEAIALKAQIIALSIGFRVVCVFTSFTEEPPADTEDELAIPACPIKLMQNSPNPFNPSTTISFEVLENITEDAVLRIYNLKGQLVYTAGIKVNGKGIYELVWNGTDLRNLPVASGVYVYSIRCGKYLLHAKMTLQK